MALELFPYQEEGAVFLKSMPRAGLFDEPGLGKTAQAIRAMDIAELDRGVVVAPASVCDVWVSEIRKFSKYPRRIMRGRTSDDLNLWLRFRSDILICSYEMSTRWRRELERDVRGFTIFDESHYLKSNTARRTRAAFGHQCDGRFGYGKWGAYGWLLTGTPMSNTPLDIWTWLRFVQGTQLTYRQFTSRYFSEIPGAFASSFRPRREMIPELRGIIQQYSLRRTLKDVGLQLPEMWITTQEVDGDTSEVRALLSEHEGLDAAVRQAVEKGGLSFLDAGHIATLRRLVGEAKAPVFARQLVEELDGGLDKVVVFCAHKAPIQILSKALGHIHHVIIEGDTPPPKRTELVKQFQSDPDCRVFIGNIIAAGTGLTLTAASQLVMLESDWTPAANAQALKRVHRIGQDRKVHVRFISLAKSIDADIAATVARKTEQIIEVQGSEL